MRSFIHIFITRLVVALITIVIIFGIFTYQQYNTSRTAAKTAAQETLTNVNRILETLIEKTEIMEIFLLSSGSDRLKAMASPPYGEAYLDDFNQLAHFLYNSSSIQLIKVMPAGRSWYSYPIGKTDYFRGKSVFRDPLMQGAALQAKLSGLTTIVGPFPLSHAGWGLAILNPVANFNSQFWGFTSLSVALPDAIEPAGLNDLTRRGYKYEFDFINGKSLLTLASTFDNLEKEDAISVTMPMVGKQAIIYVRPNHGWLNANDMFYELIFFVLALALAVFVAHLSARSKLSSLQLLQSLEQEKHLRKATVQAYMEAERANTAKSTFLSSMSHDLRTPMNSIVGLCTLLKRDANNPKKVEDLTQKLSSSSQHLLSLINDILDLSKIESGKVSLNVGEISLPNLLDSINTIVQPQVQARHQSFVIVVHHIEHEQLLADELRLRQVLLNLLSNAVKYTGVGGSVQLHVTEHASNSNSVTHFTFEVIDNGMGMPQSFLNRIFEPFSRNESKVGSKIEGTGLGMTITYNIIKLMGGTIDIRSQEGKGTTVQINVSVKIKSSILFDKNCLASNGVNHILVIDHEHDLGKSSLVVIQDADVPAEHANNLNETMVLLEKSQAENKPYDLIIVDIPTSEPDCIELLQRIKESSFCSIPIFMLNNGEYHESDTAAIDLGVRAFITKPLFLSNLVKAVKQLSQENCEVVDAPHQQSVLKGLHFLVAEDNELNSDILKELLAMRGAECTICANGQIAYDTMANSAPGSFYMILMDVQMPVLNGYDATRRIRALPNRPDAKSIPIVAMTANAFAEDVQNSLVAGMNYHIAKPVDLDLLEDYVRQYQAGISPNQSSSFVSASYNSNSLHQGASPACFTNSISTSNGISSSATQNAMHALAAVADEVANAQAVSHYGSAAHGAIANGSAPNSLVSNSTVPNVAASSSLTSTIAHIESSPALTHQSSGTAAVDAGNYIVNHDDGTYAQTEAGLPATMPQRYVADDDKHTALSLLSPALSTSSIVTASTSVVSAASVAIAARPTVPSVTPPMDNTLASDTALPTAPAAHPVASLSIAADGTTRYSGNATGEVEVLS